MNPPDLSPTLLDAAIELAGLVRPANAQRRAGPTATPPQTEHLRGHSVLNYAVTDGADPYRRIMRILYDEHQSFGLRLRPAQVADRLRERYALSTDVDWLDERLKYLSIWGAVERDHDASLASTATEWRRNRYTYDVTPAGRLTEELLARLDALGEEIGRLDTARLPSIRDALAMLASQAALPEAEGTELRSTFERVLAEVEMLHAGALTFMRSLGDLMRSVEQVGEDEFQRGKGALLEHLQGFKKSRMRYSAEILGLLQEIERSDPGALIARIVGAEEFIALPGGATLEEQRARRMNELHQRWHGLNAWFVGDDTTSPWRTLSDQVVEAIRAVLAIAERLIERRSTRVDRAGVFLHLAAQVAAAPPGDATAWLRAAFGIRTPRHVGVIEDPAMAAFEPGRTSWLDAAPAPVVAHLRTPGKRQPGTGRSAQIADLTESRRQLQQRRAAEQRELETVLTRFMASGPMTLSALEHANAAEFGHLLQWLSRAYEAPAHPDGTRRAGSIDGRATIVLNPPPNPTTARAKLRAPHGTLDLPDYRIEVVRR
jgi:uncharacterized protein (TIGR02677 family)